MLFMYFESSDKCLYSLFKSKLSMKYCCIFDFMYGTISYKLLFAPFIFLNIYKKQKQTNNPMKLLKED